MSSVRQGHAAVHSGFSQCLAHHDSCDHIGISSTVFFWKMQTQDTEFSHLAERFKIEFFRKIMLLNPGYDLFFGKTDHFPFEHQLLFGKFKIHGSPN